MTPIYFNSLWDLCLEIKAHSDKHKSQIVSYDQPKYLLIGWICQFTGQEFFIKISSIKRGDFYRTNMPDEIQKIIYDLFKTSNGRFTLSQFLSYNDPELDDPDYQTITKYIRKWNKLKVFW